MYARSDMSSIFGCGQEISESLTIRSEKMGRTMSSKRKQPQGWRKERETRPAKRSLEGDLQRQKNLDSRGAMLPGKFLRV